MIGTSLNLGDQLTVLSANSVSWMDAPASVTAVNNANYVFSVAVVNGNSIVLTVTSAPAAINFDVASGVATFTAQGGAADTINVSIVNNAYTGHQNWYLISDPAEPINLTANAVADGFVNTDANGNANSNEVIGPIAGLSTTISSLAINTSGGADVVTGIAAGAADVTISGAATLAVTGAITTTGSVTFSTYTNVDFEAGVIASGSSSVISFSNVGAITDGGGGRAYGRHGEFGRYRRHWHHGKPSVHGRHRCYRDGRLLRRIRHTIDRIG